VALTILYCSTEALKSDMQLLENGLQEAGKGKMLVPKAIDADDDDDPGPSDDDSDDDEVSHMEFRVKNPQ
jgi:hypothetical protein